MSTTSEPTAATDSPTTVTPQATEGESAVAESTATTTISLASVIALILLLLVIGGIVLAIVKVVRKRNIKEATRVKYIPDEGGYLEAEDGSRVDGRFDNRVVSFNFGLSFIIIFYDLFNFISVLQQK